MKKILVLSDSHGNIANMVRAVEAETPDLIIHLGDGWSDAEGIKRLFPEIPMEQVPGNCDYVYERSERVLEVEGKYLFLCHGHTRNVKIDLYNLQMAAQEQHADAALFGHTHVMCCEQHNGIVLLNPGSIGVPPYQVPPSYGRLVVDEKNDHIDANVIFLE